MFTAKDLKGAEGRKALADLAIRHINGSQVNQSALRTRWADLRSMSAGEAGSAGTSPSGQDQNKVIQFPLLSVHVQRVAGMAATALTQSDPWVTALYREPAKARDLAIGLQAIMEATSWDRMIMRMLYDLTLFRIAICRTSVQKNGFKHEPIAPENFIASPNYAENPMDLACHGHTFTLPLWQVKEKQAKGIYFDDGDVWGGNGEDGPRRVEMLQNSSQMLGINDADTDWLPVELAHLIMGVNVNGQMRRMRMIVAVQQDRLLRMEPYDYSRSEYWVMRSPIDPTFWPDSSPAAALQQVQDAYTTLMNYGVEGTEMAAFPPIFANLGTKAEGFKVKAGHVNQASSPGDIQSFPTPFNPQTILPIIEKLEDMAQAVMGSAPAGTAETYRSGTTAAEVIATVEGQRQRDMSFLTVAAHGIEDQWALIHELVRAHAPVIASRYGRRLRDSFWGALPCDPDWQSSGRSSAMSPAVQVALLERLYQMSTIPGSAFKRTELERSILQASGLRMGIEEVMKTDEEIAAEQMGQLGGILPGMAAPDDAGQNGIPQV